jgi:hypothetical protein
MMYQQKKFTMPMAKSTGGVACEACVYLCGPHAPDCPTQDIHRVTAAKVLGIKPGDVTDEQRREAKAANFGLRFGGGPELAPSQSLSEFCDLYGKFA